MLLLLPAIVRRRTERLERAASELGRLSPVAQVARREESLRERGRRLDAAAAGRLTKAAQALASRRVAARMDRALAGRFAGAQGALEHRTQRLVALSPDSVLARGYSITHDAESGAVLRAATATSAGRRVRIRLAAGRVGAKVDEVDP